MPTSEAHRGYPCPLCGEGPTYTTDSRPTGTGFRRRRECKACGGRFTTHEIPADLIDQDVEIRVTAKLRWEGGRLRVYVDRAQETAEPVTGERPATPTPEPLTEGDVARLLDRAYPTTCPECGARANREGRDDRGG